MTDFESSPQNRGENETIIKVHMFETTTYSKLWCECSIQSISNLVKICGFDHIELGDEKDDQTHSSHPQAKDGPMTNLQANQSAYISQNTSHSHILV